MRRDWLALVLMFGVPALLWHRGHHLPEPSMIAEGTWRGEGGLELGCGTLAGRTYVRITAPDGAGEGGVAWLDLDKPIDARRFAGVAIHHQGDPGPPLLSTGFGEKAPAICQWGGIEYGKNEWASDEWICYFAPFDLCQGLAPDGLAHLRRIGIPVRKLSTESPARTAAIAAIEFIPPSQVGPPVRLLGPDDGAQTSGQPVLRWEKSPRARGYRVTYCDGGEFVSFGGGFTRRAWFQPNVGSDQYYWEVQALGGYRFPSRSEGRSFHNTAQDQ